MSHSEWFPTRLSFAILASMDDETFLRVFETATLPKPLWTHAAHVRMAWLYLQQEADWRLVLPRVRAGINRLNLFHQNPMGYHETITIVFLRVIAHRMQLRSTPPLSTWLDFQLYHPDLLDYQRPVFLTYYKPETIFSPQARAQFVEPDLAPLP